MSELPNGWTWTTIGEVSSASVGQKGPQTSEFTYVDISSIDTYSKRIASPKRICTENAPSRARQNVRIGDVLVSLTRPNLNAVALIDREFGNAIASTGFHVVRPVAVEPRWVYFFVQSRNFIERLLTRVQGVVYPAVRPKDVAELSFPLPPPAEQRRIVAEIEKQFTRLDSASEICSKLQHKLARLSQSAFKALQPNEVNTQARRVRLRDVASTIQYGSSKKASFDSRGVAVLRMGNLSRDGRLLLESLKYLPTDHDEFPALLLQSGDILFNRTNSAELVGKSSVYRGNPCPCTFASYLIRVRTTEECLPDFLAACLNSPYGRHWISSVVSQQVGQANVNGTKLANFEFYLPPLTEQQRLISVFDQTMSLIWNIESSLSQHSGRAARLRQSILAKAFSGKLVPQDPNDEPASVLLERIKANAEHPANKLSGAEELPTKQN